MNQDEPGGLIAEQVRRGNRYIMSRYNRPQLKAGIRLRLAAQGSLPAPRPGRAGIEGFDGRAERQLETPDFGLAIGRVRGVRMWSAAGRNARSEGRYGLPVLAGDRAVLIGSTGAHEWLPGENIAACRNDPGHRVPEEHKCGCGFWAYWEWDGSYHVELQDAPVLGVIDGYGRTLTGSKGFRCEKARLAALAPAFTLQLSEVTAESGAVTPDMKAEAERASSAWLSRFQDWIGLSYPGIPVYATHRLMLAAHPTGEITAP